MRNWLKKFIDQQIEEAVKKLMADIIIVFPNFLAQLEDKRQANAPLIEEAQNKALRLASELILVKKQIEALEKPDAAVQRLIKATK